MDQASHESDSHHTQPDDDNLLPAFTVAAGDAILRLQLRDFLWQPVGLGVVPLAVAHIGASRK